MIVGLIGTGLLYHGIIIYDLMVEI